MDRLALMVASRLLLAPPEGLLLSQLVRALEGPLGDLATPESLTPVLRVHTDAGWMVRSARTSLTGPGRTLTLENLGVKGVSGGTRFDAFVQGTFCARALDWPDPRTEAERRALRSAGGLRAAIVWRAHAGAAAEPIFPGVAFVQDVLATRVLERHLGFSARAMTTPARIRGAALNMALSAALGSPSVIPAARALVSLASRAVGSAVDLDPAGLRRALLRAWVRGGSAVHTFRIGSVADAPTPGFAARLLAVARETREGRHGDERIFIAAAYDAHVRSEGANALDRATFDRELLAAARAGALRLTRADYVEAMDPDLVRRSSVRDRGVDRHFLLLNSETLP